MEERAGLGTGIFVMSSSYTFLIPTRAFCFPGPCMKKIFRSWGTTVACTARVLTEVLHGFFPSKPGRISPMSFLVCTRPRLKTSLLGLTASILPNNHFLPHLATPALSLPRSCCDTGDTNTHQRLAAKAALPLAAQKPSNPPRCPCYDADTKQSDRRSPPARGSRQYRRPQTCLGLFRKAPT